jgi:hypothetical protein
MRRPGHVAQMKVKTNAYRILVEKPQEEKSLEDQNVDGQTVLKWILDKLEWYGLD